MRKHLQAHYWLALSLFSISYPALINPADPNIQPFNYVLRVCQEVEP